MGGRGRANLISDHTQLLLLLHQAQHGFYKVLAVFGVQPGGADNNVIIRQPCSKLLFTGQLAGAIDTQRSSYIFRSIG